MLNKLKINGKLLRQLDFGIIIICIMIVVFGALNIFSATHIVENQPDLISYSYLKKQLMWLFVGLGVLYVVLIFDYSVIMSYANLIYWFGVVLLILNDFVLPKNVNGAESWMKIGPVSFQPSEFAKLGIILIIAKKLEEMDGNINSFKNFMILTVYAAIPMGLIVIQPDMGMTMVCFFIVLGMYYAAGLNSKVILGGLASVVVAVALVWNSGVIEPYQKNRLISFLNPDADPLGTGLQLIQSEIGIGSGGILGKGFLKGTQVAGQFIPEAHTDFIFSVVGEEWGLLGAIFLIVMYGLLIYKFIKIARTSKDVFGSIVCAGIVSIYMFSFIQNVGMTIGLMPITGITLPLMSYGGSSMITTFIGIGLVLNVGMRRKKINF